MEKKLIEAIENDHVEYHFVEFDDGIDFVKIIDIIQAYIKPDKINYWGIEDSHGFFEKDGLHVELEYDGLIGNWMEFKGEQTERNLTKVKEWAKIIFNNLMAQLN